MRVDVEHLKAIARDGKNDTKAAAGALEAYFLRQLMSEVRGTGGGMLDGGFAGSTFREMLDGALADAMAAGGGVGVARTLEGALGGGTAPTSNPPSAFPRQAAAAGQPTGVLTVSPVAGATASGFGRRTDPIEGDVRAHAGLDMRSPEGAPVHAAGAGRVVQAGRSGGYGNLVVIDHGGGMQTRYAHLAEIGVQTGQVLPAGAALGTVGATGRATGPHLHFEVRRDGQALDPTKEIAGLKNPR